MPINILSSRMILKDKKDRIRAIIEPDFDSNVLEKISISCYEFDFSVGKLDFFVIWTVDKGIKFYPVFQENKMTVMGALYCDTSGFEYALSFQLFFLVYL